MTENGVVEVVHNHQQETVDEEDQEKNPFLTKSLICMRNAFKMDSSSQVHSKESLIGSWTQREDGFKPFTS